MKVKLYAIALLLSVVLLSACAATPGAEQGQRDLDRWVDDQLTPYVVKQLSAHPKFKGQPILVVNINDSQVQAEIDDLTGDIRQRLVNALLKTPGVKLVWQPEVIASRQYRRMDNIPCDQFRRVRFYIGLDVDLSPMDGTLEVSVRALDLVENHWVSGFQRSWRGFPTRIQRQALSRRHQDESLRGRRLLPFTTQQPDLLAVFLAHNVRCLLRHSKTIDEVVLYAKN